MEAVLAAVSKPPSQVEKGKMGETQATSFEEIKKKNNNNKKMKEKRKSLSFAAVFFCYTSSLPENRGCVGMGEAIAPSSRAPVVADPFWTKAPLRFTSSRWATSDQGDVSGAGTLGQASHMRQSHRLVLLPLLLGKNRHCRRDHQKKKKYKGEKSSTIPLFLFLLQHQPLFASAPLPAAPRFAGAGGHKGARAEAGGRVVFSPPGSAGTPVPFSSSSRCGHRQLRRERAGGGSAGAELGAAPRARPARCLAGAGGGHGRGRAAPPTRLGSAPRAHTREVEVEQLRDGGTRSTRVHRRARREGGGSAAALPGGGRTEPGGWRAERRGSGEGPDLGCVDAGST